MAPQDLAALHRRAAGWCEANGLSAEAIDHALKAPDTERAVRLIELNAVETLLKWLSPLDSQVLRSRPLLLIVRAWVAVAHAQFDEAEDWARAAESALAQDGWQRDYLDAQGLTRRWMQGNIDAVRSTSRPTSAWRIIKATVRKELQAAIRYVPNLIGSLAHEAVTVVFFLLLSATISVQGIGVSGQRLAGRDLFISFQSGLLLTVFTGVTLWGPINAVRSDLYNGTLEFLYSNPGSRYAYYVGNVLAKVMINMVVFLPLYVLLAIYSRANLFSLLMVLLVCMAILTALTAMGVMVALLALLWRQVDSIAQVLGIMFEMIGGAYLPVTAYPSFVRYLAYPLPHTWGYDLIRYYSFEGQWQTLLPVWQEWVIIITFAVGFTLVSRYLLGKAEQLAKKSGLHVI